MANLPEQLQKQVDEAEAAMKQIGNPDEPAPDTTSDSTTVVAQATETLAAPTSNVESVQTATVPDDPNSETFAQRWRSLQGIHNNLVRKNEASNQRVSQLEHILSTLQQQPADQQVAPATPATPAGTYLTDQDRADYADSIDVMRRAAREEFAPFMEQFNQKLDSVNTTVSNQVQQVSRTQNLTRSELFYQKLDQAIPNWKEINESPEFQQWLSEIDPLTGIQRQIYLNDAHQQMDVGRVAQFFRTGAVVPQAQQVQAPTTPQTVTTSPASQLELQISPSRTKGTDIPVDSTQKKIWSRAGISKFYDDVRRGVYAGKDAERSQIENDIIAASSENRIAAS